MKQENLNQSIQDIDLDNENSTESCCSDCENCEKENTEDVNSYIDVLHEIFYDSLKTMKLTEDKENELQSYFHYCLMEMFEYAYTAGKIDAYSIIEEFIECEEEHDAIFEDEDGPSYLLDVLDVAKTEAWELYEEEFNERHDIDPDEEESDEENVN